MQLFVNTWGIETMAENEARQNAFTKSNLRSLQVLENKVLRLMTGSSNDTPTIELLQKANMMSVNQLSAYYSLVTVFNVKQSGKPQYLADRLGFNGNIENEAHRRGHNISNVDYRLARGREGMLYRGTKLYNSLDPTLKTENSAKLFKKKLTEWILRKIPPIPY